MSEHDDRTVEELLGSIPTEPDVSPYVATWGGAVLKSFETYEPNEYGYRVGLVFDLDGNGKKFTTMLFLPGTSDGSESGDIVTEIAKNKLASILHAARVLPRGIKISRVTTAEEYSVVLNLLNRGIEQNVPINIKQRKDSDFLDVWGLRPKRQ